MCAYSSPVIQLMCKYIFTLLLGYNNSVIIKCLILYIICCDHYMIIMFTYK